MNGRAAKRIHRAKWRMLRSKQYPAYWNIGDIENQLKREYYAKPYHQHVIMEGIVPSRTHKQQRQFDLNPR